MTNANPVNWLFLAELCVVVIVTAAFLFYWNRLLGSAIAAVIRIISWRAFNVYIVIGSFQISPLAGRIAFRDVEYHSSNISFRALHGNITFRYWKPRVRQDDDSESSNPKRARLPCRIVVNAEGVEAFFYNRTPAYDAIVERMKKHERGAADARGEDSSPPSDAANASRSNGARLRKRPAMSRDQSSNSSKPTTSTDEIAAPKPETPAAATDTSAPLGLSWFMESLPLDIRIVTGSIVLGSDATPMILIADFKRASGIVEVTDARSICDLYKTSYNLQLQDLTVLMRTNPDHSGTLLAHGKRVYDELLNRKPELAEQTPSSISTRSGFHRIAKLVPQIFDLPSVPVGVPTDRVWKGLARYRLDETEGSVKQREEPQYAKVATLLTTRAMDITYASDAPGPVPESADACDIDPTDQIGNIEPPPEYGVDIVLHGGNINYGPWADRQRDALQKAFAPSIFFDSEPRARLRAGETRVHSTMVVNVTMTEKTTLRIPTREPSKNWQFDNVKGPVERKYGWLDVVVGPNSSVCYTQAQVATQHGYDSMMVLHLDSLDIASSVNLQSFVVAKACKLSMTMPTPLVWDAQRSWGIDMTLDTPDILLMREHVALISDLSRDWSGATTGDFRHFVPMHYSFRVSMVNYALHLFINDFNIVDVPRSRDHNAFVDIAGPRLDACVAVSSTRYRPEFSIVPFTIEAKDARVDVGLPNWDTHRTFGRGGTLEVGKVNDLKVSGSYRYYSMPKPDHVEMLKLHIEGERVAFKALGWVVRRLFCVKDNYFGNFTQFSTMQEFLEKFDHSPDSVGDPIIQKYRPGRSDSFAVHLTVDVRDSLVLMSDEIYGVDNGIAIPVPHLQLDLKTGEFQMDMTLDAAPTYAIACDSIDDAFKAGSGPLARSQDVVFVEGIVIKANRLFGPQPRATTYFCLWELNFARISAFLSPEFKERLAGVGSAVGCTFTDRDNAPASIYLAKTPPDATFVKLTIDHVTALLSEGSSAIAIELPRGIFIDTSSMASQSCGSVMGLGLPSISAHILRRAPHHRRWDPVGTLGTGVSVDIYKVPKGWEAEAKKQQEFMKEQDEPTMRVPFLWGGTDKHPDELGVHVSGIYLPRPQKPDIGWPEPSEADSAEDRLLDYDSSSPGTSSDDHSIATSIPLSRMSRKRRSRGAMPAVDEDSLGDESDSVSSVSTASSHSTTKTSGTGILPDPAAILEDRLQSFRRIHQRARRVFDHATPGRDTVDDPTNDDMPFSSLTITDGAIFRINLEKTMVDLNPATVFAAHAVMVAMGAVQTPTEALLDQLLTSHVSAVLKDSTERGSALYDINLPSLDVRVAHGRYSSPDSLVQLSLTGTNCRVVQTPVPDSEASTTDASVGVKTLAVTVSRHQTGASSISLLDVPSIALEARHDKTIPFVHLSTLDLGLTFHNGASDQTIQVKSRDISVHGATASVPVISYLLDEWQPVFKSLKDKPAGYTFADAIYDIVNETVSNSNSMSLPAFMYEGSYGLHVSDQRNIRKDFGWFTLSRLRHWYRLAQREHLTPPPSTKPHPSRAEMARAAVAELLKIDEAFGVGEELIVSQPFLIKAFGKDLKTAGQQPAPPKNKSRGIFVNADSVSVRHHGRLLENNSIVPSILLIEGTTIASQKTVTYDNGGVPTTDVRTHVTVQNTNLDLRNSFLAAHEAILTHFQTHRKEIHEEFHEIPVVQTFDHASVIVVDMNLGKIGTSITAGGLCLDLGIEGAQGSATIERGQTTDHDHNMHHNQEHNAAFLNCSSVSAVLREAADEDRRVENTERVLVTSALRGLRFTADTNRNSASSKAECRLLLGVESLDFDSRPQLKAFYDFGRDWRETHYPLYEPAFEQLKAVLDQRRSEKSTPRTTTPSVTPKPHGLAPSWEEPSSRPSLTESMMIDVYIGAVHMQARAAKGLWLGWDMGQVYITRQGSNDLIQFGLRVEPQVVGAYTTAKRIRTKDSSIVRLPSIMATGTYKKEDGRPHLTTMVNLGMFTGIIKPAVLDRLLSLHQRLGNDVMEVLREYRGQQQPTTPPEVVTPPNPTPLIFRVQASIAGVRVGLRADDVPTTLMFEALELNASASNLDGKSLQWNAKANHVGLSLIRLTDGGSYQNAQPLRGSRSVSMMFDIAAGETPGADNTPSKLSISFSRVHTVMHVAALSEVSDLIRSWSSDISVLREVHAQEMAEVKERTTRVLKKIETSSSNPALSGSGASTVADNAMAIETWFSRRVLTLDVSGIGVAIPLDHGTTIDFGKSAGGGGPALLYSIRMISLTTSRNETARFRVQQTSLQFLEKFDAGIAEHFSGAFHTTSNRMVLPTIEMEGQMSSTDDSWNINAHCSATDFKLSLTPDIADGIASLVEMYDHGKVQLQQMERDYLTEWAKTEGEQPESVATKYDADALPKKSKHLVVHMSFRFDSGLVELHRPIHMPDANPENPVSARYRPRRIHHDSFFLPTVSMWMDFNGPDVATTDQTGALLFNIAVHESRNVLRPTILPWFVEMVNRIEQRSKSHVARRPALPKATSAEAVPIAERALEQFEKIENVKSNKLKLRVTLRIDRSELRLSCAPDSNAYIDLKWESGGFAVSTLLGGKDQTSLAGAVSGVTAYLSHEFAEQGRGCVTAGAKDLAFSVTLCSQDVEQRGLSIVLDTEIAVQFRLEAFSAWLIFMSVWVDNAPKLDSFLATDPTPAAAIVAPVPASSSNNSKLGVVALIRFRSVDFDANVAVTQARLQMTPIVIRTVSNGERTEFDLNIGVTKVTAEGDISGDICSQNLRFVTVRRSKRSTATSESNVLSMAIEGGDLRGNMFISGMNIVRFQLEPSRVTLEDDWAAHSLDPSAQVALNFIVKAGNFSGVLRLPAIPRLLGDFYSIFDMVESQKKIAVQRSETFKARQKRGEDSITPMTTVVLPQAPKRAMSGLGVPQHTSQVVKTAQMMRFELSGIDIGIFSEDYDDGTPADFYRFYIGKIEADLKRQESNEGLPLRDLLLHVSFVEWQTSDGQRATRIETHDMTPRTLIDEAIKPGHRDVVVLPLMTLRMKSTELKDPNQLDYDFDLVWGQTDGDIKILPNFFEAAFKSFRKLLRGIDEQQVRRARRRGIVHAASSAKLRKAEAAGETLPDDKPPELIYHRRGTGPFNNPVPKLRALGETTGDAAMMIPRIKGAVGELPAYSHRFVTLPLEDGMDILLKLYEKQLPEIAS